MLGWMNLGHIPFYWMKKHMNEKKWWLTEADSRSHSAQHLHLCSKQLNKSQV